jgi:anaerobic ribonucleoside-triphosphate reductase activating protein
MINQIKNNPLIFGITFSGGDPLENGNDKDLLPLLKIVKENNINVWVYTGYTYEEILNDPIKKECLDYIDTLVEGEFKEELKNPNLLFRGSSNQRIFQKQWKDEIGYVFTIPEKYNHVES